MINYWIGDNFDHVNLARN